MLYTILEITLVFVAVALIISYCCSRVKARTQVQPSAAVHRALYSGLADLQNFLSHVTAVLAAIFFVLALAMAYMSHHVAATPQSIVEKAAQQQATTAKTSAPTPAAPQTNPAGKNAPPDSKPAGKPTPAKPPLH